MDFDLSKNVNFKDEPLDVALDLLEAAHVADGCSGRGVVGDIEVFVHWLTSGWSVIRAQVWSLGVISTASAMLG